ncbi:hypothetical protein KC19_7G007100 [Ceratodon purpureus]|uniref:RING-type domain-containing protein n=1 Tax=Ceratodon purpureus TaxID=3225 RepID=A0A8T0H1B7_CERPU|nr:hypothetical protein KC19_7G007100 [Ceratodon purpureus]
MEHIQVNAPDGSVRKFRHGVKSEDILTTLRATYGVGDLTDSEGYDILYSDDVLDAGLYTYIPIPSSAAARSFFIAEQNAIAHDAQIGTSHLSVTANMTYESLVQLENVRCVASATVVAALPVCSFEKEQAASFDQASEVCIICQDHYEPGDSQVKLPCQHAFHEACGAEWLLNYSKLCPLCKQDITDAATIASSPV